MVLVNYMEANLNLFFRASKVLYWEKVPLTREFLKSKYFH